jgi:hypothetical protein
VVWEGEGRYAFAYPDTKEKIDGLPFLRNGDSDLFGFNYFD